jgi:hypothetical protein
MQMSTNNMALLKEHFWNLARHSAIDVQNMRSTSH